MQPLNRDQMERLIFCKYLLTQAKHHSDKGSPLSSFTILILHDLLEIFLQVALEVHAPEKIKNQNYVLVTTAKEINEKLAERDQVPINLMFLKRLNELRNSLKHASIFSNQQLVSNIYYETESFLNDYPSVLFKISLNELKLTSLISSTVIREYMIAAEKEMDESRHLTAVVALTKAFCVLEDEALVAKDKYSRNMLAPLPNPMYSYRVRTNQQTMSRGGSNDDGLKMLMDLLTKDTEKVHQKIFDIETAIAFNINYKDLLKVREILIPQYVVFGGRDENGKRTFKDVHPEFIEQELQGATLDDARFCFNFILDAALISH